MIIIWLSTEFFVFFFPPLSFGIIESWYPFLLPGLGSFQPLILCSFSSRLLLRPFNVYSALLCSVLSVLNFLHSFSFFFSFLILRLDYFSNLSLSSLFFFLLVDPVYCWIPLVNFFSSIIFFSTVIYFLIFTFFEILVSCVHCSFELSKHLYDCSFEFCQVNYVTNSISLGSVSRELSCSFIWKIFAWFFIFFYSVLFFPP